MEDNGVVGGELPHPYTEPHLAADPGDPDHLVVASIVGFTRAPDHRSWRCAVMLSRNGGRSWEERSLDLGRCADPWVALESENAWLASLHDLERGGRGLAIHRSSDGGGSWSADPVVVGPGHDHPTLVKDGRGGIYVVSAFLAGRTSHASVFPLGVEGLPPQPILRSLPATANTFRSVVMRDGTLVVPVTQFSRFVEERQERIDPPHVGAVRFRPESTSFTGPEPITRRCGSRKGFGSAAIDETGGTYDQRIYLACVSHRGGDLLVISSDDGGITWSSPTQVLGIPDPDVEGTALRRAVGIAVNPSGIVGVVWQDRGADQTRRCQVQRFAASGDGGGSFSDPVDLSTAPSCPATRRNAAAAAQWPAGSDYGSVVALSDGRFRAVWADARTGIYRIRMATARVRE